MHREGIFEKHRLDTLSLTAAAVGGAPQAHGFIGPVPQGYAWYIENVAYNVVGNSHTAQLLVATTVDDGAVAPVATWDGQGLQVALAAAVRGQSPPGIAYYAGQGHVVHAVLVPGTLANADVVTVTFQVAVHQLDPAFIMSPEDAKQVLERHERMAGAGATGLNMDAVGATAV